MGSIVSADDRGRGRIILSSFYEVSESCSQSGSPVSVDYWCTSAMWLMQSSTATNEYRLVHLRKYCMEVRSNFRVLSFSYVVPETKIG